jgi:hypothetical protein
MKLWLALGEILAQKLRQKDNEIFDHSNQPPATNQTQHNRNMAKMILSKPFVHHCLNLSWDDEMAEKAFEWCSGWSWVGF